MPTVNPERLKKAPNIAIVGSTSPLGKELREVIEGPDFPVGKLSLLETEEYAGLLQEFAGEIRITQILSPETFADTDIAFFACGPEIINAYASSGAAFPELTIDLTQTGRPGTLFLGGVSDASLLRTAGYYITPHPAAIALGRVLARIRNTFQLESVSATVLEPASERGLSAINELQEQTVGLLNFQPVEHKVFSGQLAFNILNEAETARRVEALVRDQLAGVLGKTVPVIAIAAIQAPVFHSHALSLFVQLKDSPSLEQVRASLEVGGAGVLVHSDEGLSPSPVTVVGSDAVHVARLAADPSRPGSFFLWIVADNLRVAASNALQIAESLMFAPARN
jgi:aspartate-semialdehyde dehydrogenase